MIYFSILINHLWKQCLNSDMSQNNSWKQDTDHSHETWLSLNMYLTNFKNTKTKTVYFIFTFCWIIFYWLLEQSDILKSAQEQNHFFMLISYGSNLHVEPNWGSCSREKAEKIGLWCCTIFPQSVHRIIYKAYRTHVVIPRCYPKLHIPDTSFYLLKGKQHILILKFEWG